MSKSARDKRIISLGLILGLIIIILNPIGIPIRPDEYTKRFYEDLKALPDGSVVLFQAQAPIAYIPEIQPATIAIFNLLFSKNIKIIVYSIVEEAPIYIEWLFAAIKKSILDQNTYGEDYVIFGFVPGQENAMASMGSDIRSVYKVDTYGTPIEDLPIMDTINNAADVDVIIPISGSTPLNEASVRVWSGTYAKDIYILTSGTDFASAQPYYPTQVKGLTNGVLGGAQLEVLVGTPGKGAQFSDSLSYAFMFAIATIIARNILYFRERGRIAK